ncbi:(2Fe-2S)-binding protein [Labrys wisconsinensis]|uniref:Carbon-monoxide dehydrogenase small subunit n=1 Tax=Labrys wisconsinensis TaxID=425677 RepID=A0ABU0J5S8_9HYPH|nr:(2Fe-2S)-binding protein [Labrys wisconsinensis]MDQ0469616.1 carbon-monoxide dehydrogenase small subunit [Labrys wisconsinensis]
MKSQPVAIIVNGQVQEILVRPGTTLLRTLRDALDLTGAKAGCEGGTCGTCTVHIDGTPVLACCTLTELVDGGAITTIEGLADGEVLHPIQAAFYEGFATQCGFCNAGMIMAAKGLLDRTLSPSREEAMAAISGNVCRCTGYEAIVDAVLDAAARLRALDRRAA